MRWMPVGLVVALLACPVHSLAETPQGKEKPRTVTELVTGLSDPDYHTREKAQNELWLRGDVAIPALEKAASGSDPEAASRARTLLDRFGWGLRHDTPPAIVKLVRQYQRGDPHPERSDEIRKQAITDLLKLGRPGVAVVRSILKKDLPGDIRTTLALNITTIVRREVPHLIAAGKTSEADELISLHETGTTAQGAADFAAYHALRGDLADVIKQCEAELKTTRQTASVQLALTYLYRAAGQWAKARAAAANIPRAENEVDLNYKEQLLEDEGDWSAIADLPVSSELNHPDAVRLSLLRLAGRKEKFEELAKQVRTNTGETSEPQAVLNAAFALLANHRVDDATDLLLERRTNLALLSEILIARMRYKEVTDFIGEVNDEKKTISRPEQLEFKLRRARVLMLAGDRETAVKVFEEVARELPTRHNNDDVRGIAAVNYFDHSARMMVRTEIRVGLRDLACEHAARYVPPEQQDETTARYRYSGESPFELLFLFDATVAETLFHVLRAKKIPGDNAGATMLRVRDLLNGTAGKASVDQAAQLVREASFGDKLQKAHRYLTLAQMYRAAKRTDEALDAFKVAAELTASSEDAAEAVGARSWVFGTPDPARVWLEWGDFLAESGLHRDAAAVYEAGWKQFPDQPTPLFLSGVSLVRAGDKKEGERRIELSHWVALGNERLRGRFLDELIRRSESAAIKREISLILKACWSRDHFFGNVMNQCGRGANLVGDYPLAELCGQRSLFVVLRTPGVYFVDTVGYLNVPLELLVFRAKGELAAGKIDEAMATARRVLEICPGHLDLVNGMVPQLDKQNRKKEADELFQRAWGAYQKMLADYPGGAAARNAMASLSGHCQRKLDDGLKYAKAAVVFDPGSPQYRESLAEVHFRRGDRDAALKLMQKLSDEQPRNSAYRRQLTRYHTAAFDSFTPYVLEEDD